MSEEENATPVEESEEPIQIMDILNESLKSADKDNKRLDEELAKIRTNSDQLKAIVYKPYKKGEVPDAFGKSDSFLSIWDKSDRALGNTILMIMPPQIFESMEMPERQPQQIPQQPIIISTGQNEKPVAGRQPSRGFWSGMWDLSITKAELKAKLQRPEKPTITGTTITYNPKEIVYQLIPSLHKLKDMYSDYLKRHESYEEPSWKLLELGHMRMREEMSKYFDVVNPFCYASIVFQKEKIRRDKLTQVASFSRIAEGQAMMGMYGGMPGGGGGPPAKQDSLGLQMYINRAVQREVERRERERKEQRRSKR